MTTRPSAGAGAAGGRAAAVPAAAAAALAEGSPLPVCAGGLTDPRPSHPTTTSPPACSLCFYGSRIQA